MMYRRWVLPATILVLLAALAVVLWVCLPGNYNTLTIESTEGAKEPYDIVTLDVSLADNPGFTTVDLVVSFDPERLSFDSLAETYADAYGQTVPYISNAHYAYGLEEDGNLVRVRVDAETTVSGDGSVLGLTFQVTEDADVGVADVSVVQIAVENNGKSVDTVWVDGGILVGEMSCQHGETSLKYASLDGKTHNVMQICKTCDRVVTKEKEYCIDTDTSGACDLCLREIFANINIHTADISLGQDLMIDFIMEIKDPEEAMASKAVIWKGYTKGSEVTEVSPDEWKKIADDKYSVSTGVKFQELVLPIVVEVKDARGNLASNIFSITMGEVAYRRLQSEGITDAEKTFMVDFLNFVTEVQKRFDLNTENLANKELTEEQLAYGSAPVTYENNRVMTDKVLGTSVSIESGIVLSVLFKDLTEQQLQSMYAMIDFTDYRGIRRQIKVSPENILPYSGGADAYTVVVDQLSIADVSQMVTVTLYHADGSEYGSCTDSVESYLCRMAENNKNLEIGEAMMKLAASSKVLLK